MVPKVDGDGEREVISKHWDWDCKRLGLECVVGRRKSVEMGSVSSETRNFFFNAIQISDCPSQWYLAHHSIIVEQPVHILSPPPPTSHVIPSGLLLKDDEVGLAVTCGGRLVLILVFVVYDMGGKESDKSQLNY